MDAPPEASQNQALTSGQRYRVVSMFSGQAMDIAGCATANAAVVDQWGYWRGTCQQWTLQSSLGGYRFVGAASGRCLDVPGGSRTAGQGVALWDCLNNTVQAWNLNQQADGSYTIVNQNSGLCLDIPNNSIQPGLGLDQWTCNGGTNQTWRLEPVDGNGVPTFGNQTLHPQKLGFYMVPDFWNEYVANWPAVQSALNILHQVMPNAWVRWDNETGHNYTWPNGDSQANVDAFLGRAQTAGVPMIIAASAVNGYNNYWANNSSTPVFGLRDFANSGFVQWAVAEMNKYSVVKMVETPNEANTSWFVNDADNTADFDYYMNVLNSAVSPTSGRVLGPATAWNGGQIWDDWMGRNYPTLSYHVYSGAAGLYDYPGKQVYITEYGPSGSGNLDPALLLSDLWTVEQTGKLNTTIQKLFYEELLDNSLSGRARGAINSQAMEGSHFAFRDYFRAMMTYQGQASTNAMLYPSGNDFFATDDGNGNTSVLAWNNSTNTESNRYIFVPGTTLGKNAALYVTKIVAGEANVIQCVPIGAQNWVTAAIGKPVDGNSPPSVLGVTVNTLEPHAAIMVSTVNNCGLLTQ